MKKRESYRIDTSHRDSVGKISEDILKNASVPDHTPAEQAQAMLEDWEKNMIEAIQNGKHSFNGDFFIVVETKKEYLMKNVLRNYFLVRQSCPTPTWDTSVFHYHRSDEHCEFLWVLPSRDTYKLIKDNPLQMMQETPELVKFVLDDTDGTLLKRCKILNGEIL